MKRALLALAAVLAAAATDASAFCVFNDLKDKAVVVTQEEHPDWKRQDARFQKTIAPGQSSCCEFKDMNCNPNGRQNSLVGLEVAVAAGETPLKCGPVGTPEKGRQVKLSGDGTLRIVPNPKLEKGSTAPYVARIWTHDKQDVTGPSGLPCR
jgi:hypothetical protein